MLKNEGNKGITLIALIVTIVVLLILAGVTINAITGSESAMEKATEAREKDKQGTELETIKLAVVNAVASDLTGLVNADNLKEGLNGLVEDEGRLRINKDNSPWIVTGKTGMKYKINQNGEITSAEPVSSVEFVKTEDTIAVGKSKKLEIIAKGASGNKTEANEVIFSSSDEDIATVEDDGSIKIVNDDSKIGETVTISVVADEVEGSNECEITVNPDYKIGSNITYVTSHNDVELRDWKIFYKTENYVYLILSDYLPFNAIGNISGIIQYGNNYAVKSSNNRVELINAMTIKSNWTSLLKGTINGKEIDYRSLEGENIYAMGSPTLDLFVQSWNEKYPNNETYSTNQIYIAQTSSTMNDGLLGYYASRSNPATTTWVSMSGSEGYINQQNMDTLYFLNSTSNSIYKAEGYWLATPNANGINYVFTAKKSGALNCNEYSCQYVNDVFAFRPIVCLPISVLE